MHCFYMNVSEEYFLYLIKYLFQQMHYTILVFSCPYLSFGTNSAIFRGFRREFVIFIIFNASKSLPQTYVGTRKH